MEGALVSGELIETNASNVSDAERGPAMLLGPLEGRRLPRYLLMPGDPERISIIAELWDEAEEYQLPRGFRAAIGTFRDVEVGAVSSGMGAPSLELMLTEAVLAGADTVIRVGTSGSLHEEIPNDDLIINDAAVRLDGTTEHYVRPEYPAAASYEVVTALVDACRELGVVHHVGLGATTSSFYAGQGRANPVGFETRERAQLLDEMRAGGVLNFEMEGAALMTLGRLFGVRTGVITSVIANRVTGQWGDGGGVRRACLTASIALQLLRGRDALSGTPSRSS